MVVYNEPKMAKFEGNNDQTTVVTPEFGSFYAERNCPQCGKHLDKGAPDVKIVCMCGWVWS